MNDFQKSQASKILSCYSQENDLEKGGKRAFIGEVRKYNGQDWVKHQDGWVLLHSSGNHILERPGGKREKASDDHVSHAKQHLDIKKVDDHQKMSKLHADRRHNEKVAWHLELLGEPDANITYKNYSNGDEIVFVNGQTAFNNSSKGLTDEFRTTALKRAYKASKKEENPKKTEEDTDKKFSTEGIRSILLESGIKKEDIFRLYRNNYKTSVSFKITLNNYGEGIVTEELAQKLGKLLESKGAEKSSIQISKPEISFLFKKKK